MTNNHKHEKGAECGCGTDISDRHKSTKFCMDCTMKKDRKRYRKWYWKNK